MDFTREPIVETVITPKEGFKLVVRSSKSSGQEEYFVDAVEVVSFGNSFFFRSLERPKSFLVPATDYELLEVREARMVLKNVGLDRSIKIGGGREAPAKQQQREPAPEKVVVEQPAQPAEEMAEARLDKRRDKRRHTRRRRGRDDVKEGEGEAQGSSDAEAKIDLEEPLKLVPRESASAEPLTTSSSILSSILPPPPTLISDTIARYKENAMFKGAFFMKDEEQKSSAEDGEQPKREEEPFPISIEEPHLNAFTMEDEEEDLFQHRTTLAADEPPVNHPEEPSNT